MVRRRITTAWVGALLLCAAARASALDLDGYDALLERHSQTVDDVAGTRVDYRGLRDAPAWRALVASLAAAPRPAPGDRDATLAFWINAYNILAIDLVVQHQPRGSIRDIGSLLRPVWKREAGVVAGRPYSLHHIEHEILRPLGDPRIHAAIVCASLSCPSLRRSAYRGAGLDAQLDAQVRQFLGDPRKGLRFAAGELWLSKIFRWFEEDFAAGGGVLPFVSRYLDEAGRARLRALGPEPELHYLDYDWQLNALARRRQALTAGQRAQ